MGGSDFDCSDTCMYIGSLIDFTHASHQKIMVLVQSLIYLWP